MQGIISLLHINHVLSLVFATAFVPNSSNDVALLAQRNRLMVSSISLQGCSSMTCTNSSPKPAQSTLRQVTLFASRSTISSSASFDFDDEYDDDDDNEDDDKMMSGTSSSTRPGDSSTILSKQLQTGNHFFSQKSLEDPRFYTITAISTPEEEAQAKKQQSKSMLLQLLCKEIFTKLCRGSSIEQPSRIQALAWPVLLQNHHTIVADQTGSGKSYGYLIPLILRMQIYQKQKQMNNRPTNNSTNHKTSITTRSKNAPEILILTPTSELASQIYNVCKKLSKHVAFRTELALSAPFHRSSATSNMNIQNNNNNNNNNDASSIFQRNQVRTLTDPKKPPVDILVATPGRVASLLRAGHLDLTYLQAFVLDEVDVLMIDETFGPQLKTVGVATPSQTQFVFVTATLPDSVVDNVKKEFPAVQVLKGPGLHRIAPTLKEVLVDVSVPSGTSNRDAKACFNLKAEALTSAIRKNKSDRTLIFCNTVESCRSIENYLNRRDRRGKLCRVGAYHGAMSSEARNEALASFSAKDKENEKSSNNDSNVDRILVCTDRAARGVDFGGAKVDHVVIFDFPKDPAEYIRRVGRTARAGRTGLCTVFAYGWQLPIARKIMGKKPSVERNTAGNNDALLLDDSTSNHAMLAGNIASGKLWRNRTYSQLDDDDDDE